MERWQLARDLAARKSVEFSRAAEETNTASERSKYKTLAGQYLKAAAELDKGNHPRFCAEGWIVESRSNLIGRIAEVKISPNLAIYMGGLLAQITNAFTQSYLDTGEIVPIPDDAVRLKLVVTGGDVYLYDPLTHKCQCAALDSGCWHSCMCEVWEAAGSMITVPEEDMPDWEDISNGEIH